MRKRINIELPDKTSEMLRERLKREALTNAERDLAMSAEWSALEEEAWDRESESSGLEASGQQLAAIPKP